jgi:GMP synthase-like glutamine amidotransferase
VRILYVLSEHEGGLTRERAAAYERDCERLASLTEAEVAIAPYWSLEAPDADVLVLSGSTDPWALHDPVALERHHATLNAFPGPVLGICAGMQNLVRARGGTIGHAAQPVYGFTAVDVVDGTDLLCDCPASIEVLQRHDDEVTSLPAGLRVIASSAACPVEAIAADDRPWWGTQFHPEAWDDEHPAGRAILERFLHLAGAPLRSGAA